MSSRAQSAALRANDAHTRQLAAENVVGHAGGYVPPVLGVAANELAREGRTAEASRYWLLGYLRLLTEAHAADDPPMANALRHFGDDYMRDVSPALRAALMSASAHMDDWIAETVALDDASPRLYPIAWPSGRDLDEMPDGTFAAAPSNPPLDAARQAALEDVRRRMTAWRARRLAEDAVSAAISRNEIPAQAATLIPAAWRTRIRPLRSIDTGCVRTLSPRVSATPAGATPGAFLVACDEFDTQADIDAGALHIWLNAQTGAELSRARFTEATNGKHRFIIGADGAPRYPAFGATLTQVNLLDADGRTTSIDLPRWYAGEGAAARVDVSASGHWIEMHQAAPQRSAAVIDARTLAVVWSRQFSLGPAAESFGGFAEVAGRETALLMRPSQTGAELVLLDVLTGAERTLALPAGAIFFPQPHDDTHILYVVPSPASAGLIDLETLRITWRGRTFMEAPAPQWDAACDIGWRESADRGPARAFHTVYLGGQSFELQSPTRAPIAGCAVTPDRSRLIVLAPPFAHLYAIGD